MAANPNATVVSPSNSTVLWMYYDNTAMADLRSDMGITQQDPLGTLLYTRVNITCDHELPPEGNFTITLYGLPWQ